MLTTERQACDGQVQLLCAAFNVPPTSERLEAFWLGFSKLPLLTFQRLVERALGEGGPEKMPTVPQMWRLYRRMQSEHRSTPSLRVVRSASGAQMPALDEFDVGGNLALLSYLLKCQGVSDASLEAMKVERARLVRDFRQMAAEGCGSTQPQMRADFWSAFDRCFEPRTAEETVRDQEAFQRLGHVPTFTSDERMRA